MSLKVLLTRLRLFLGAANPFLARSANRLSEFLDRILNVGFLRRGLGGDFFIVKERCVL